MPALDLDAHATAALLDTIATAQAEIARIDTEIEPLQAKKEPWQGVIDACVEQLKVLMGDAEEALLGGQPVATYKTSTRTTVDVTRLRAEHPALVEGYLRPTTSRRFRLVTDKAGE